MAPQVDEWGTKVGLLTGLVVVCAVRPLLERFLPAPASVADDIGQFATRLARGSSPRTLGRALARVAVAGAAVLVLGVAIVAAGTPARGPVAPIESSEIANRLPEQIDPSTFPTITTDVPSWDTTISEPAAQSILVSIAENLELENQALLERDGSILEAVDHGDRLAEMQARLEEAEASGETVVRHYSFDEVHVVLISPFGVQTSSSLGFESTGTVVEETYDEDGNLVGSESKPFETTFVTKRPFGDRWMLVGVLPGTTND
jgi:hypothetical protein